MKIEEIFKNACWVGLPEEQFMLRDRHKGSIGTTTAYFRNSFMLSEKADLKLGISANSRYRLWINGKAITSGPCKGDRFRRYCEVIDAGKYLKTGENLIAVKVVDYTPYEACGYDGKGPTSIITNAAAVRLITGGVCKDENENILYDVSTGKSDWKVYLDNAVKWVPTPMTEWMGAMEEIDGSLIPHGWKELGNTEGIWSDAVNIESAHVEPWASDYGIIPAFPLIERPIPLLYEREKKFVHEMEVRKSEFETFTFANKDEVELPSCGKYVIELNARELTTGYFNLKVKRGKGSKITIKYAEAYSRDVEGKGTVKGVRDNNSDYDFIGHEDIYYPSGKDEEYQPFWFRTFRFVRIEVETGDENLHIYSPVYYETGYPLEVKSEVSSSEAWINSLWDISLRTLKRCMHETYEDCPYYEQLQYAMDTRLQILFTYLVSGDTRLARKAIEDFAASLIPEGILQSRYPSVQPQIIPAFALYWIVMVEDYYIQTGDRLIIKKYRSIVDTILNWYDDRLGSSGLVERLGHWEFIDWVKQWDRGVPEAVYYGSSTIHNLIYAYALKTAARMNRETDRSGLAKEYEDRAMRIIGKVEELCFCEREGLYMEGPGFESYSVHTQLWAVLSKAAVGKKAKYVLRKAISMTDIPRCSFVMTFFLFRALEEADIYEDTEKLWDMWKELLPLKLTTMPEDQFQPRSDCHAWGALPLYEFTTRLLGVKPAAPGWKGIVIEPHTLSIKDMKGSVITPAGPVEVEWKVKNGRLNILVKSPEGVPCIIKQPDGNVHELYNGGEFIVD